jgi:cytidylate kinase
MSSETTNDMTTQSTTKPTVNTDSNVSLPPPRSSHPLSLGSGLPIVAIDGVLGSGKTTVAQRLAAELGLQYLDTGAMYRSVGLACAWANVSLSDETAVTAVAIHADIDVRSDAEGLQQVRLNGDDVTSEIRTADAARDASTVATIAGVRAALVAQQRNWGNRHGGGVLEGRDIATVVFPDAPAKIYLTASEAERARRRHAEQPARTLEEVTADLAWRDGQDSNRAADPLRVADDATVVDTTAMTLDEVVERCVAIARERFVAAGVSIAAKPTLSVDAPKSTNAFLSASSRPPGGPLSVSDSRVESSRVEPSRVEPRGDASASSEVSEMGSTSVDRETPSDKQTTAQTKEIIPQYEATRNEKILWWLARFLVLGFSRLYFRVTFEGLENVPKSGAYLVSPTHRSNVDSFVVLGLTKRRIRFLAKEEMWKLSFVHPLWDALGGIKVERGSTDRESMKLCMAALASGEPLAAYPEGTRREGPLVEGLFDGPAYMALKAGVPIVPMGIGGSALAMGRGDKFPKPKHIHVVIGKPLNSPPSSETGRRHIRALTAELGTSLQALLDEAQQKA